MAKKGNRVQVILECTEHKDSGMAGTSRYITTKNKLPIKTNNHGNTHFNTVWSVSVSLIYPFTF